MRRLATALALAFLLAPAPAPASRIECITTATIDGDLLSATLINLRGKSGDVYNIEIYSDAEAVSAPATCTSPGGTVVTCNGFDGTGSAEIFFRCDPNATPFLQMENTTTYTAAVNVGRVLSAECQVRLKIVDDGATNSACFYLSIVGGNLDNSSEVQDGSTKGSWAENP